MAEVLFRAKLTREEVANPWGFRLQGGVEFDKPLTLLKVVPDSLAAKGGLHPGDIVVKLAGKSADDMTHKDAQEAIINAGNALEIIVERAEVTITTNSPSSPPEGNGLDSSEQPKLPVPPESKSQASSSGGEHLPNNGEDGKKEIVVTESSKHSDKGTLAVTVNSVPEETREACNTNNNVKEMLTLETRGENSLLEKPPAVGGSANEIVPSSEGSASESKSKVKQDNNIRKGTESATIAKQKFPPDKTDMTQTSSLENERNVSLKSSPSEVCDKPKDVTVQNEKSKTHELTKTPNDKKAVTDPIKGTEERNALSHSDKEGMARDDSPKLSPARTTTKSDSSMDAVDAGRQVGTSEDGDQSRQQICASSSDTQSKDSKNWMVSSPVPNSVSETQSQSVSSKTSSGICDKREQVKSDGPTALVDTVIVEERIVENDQLAVKCSRDTLVESAKADVGKDNLSKTPGLSKEDQLQEESSNNISETSKASKLDVPHDTEASPTVIKEFQSNDEPVLSSTVSSVCPNSTSHQGVDNIDVSSSTDKMVISKTSTTDDSPEATPKPNIPQSSPASSPDIQQPQTIAMVITEVPKPTIRASTVEVTTPLTTTNISPSLASTVSKLTKGTPKAETKITTKSDKAPSAVTYTPVTIRNQKGVALAQTVLKSPSEPASKQTQAPTEEIIVAPKPSVQIMATQDSNDSAKVKAGEKRLEEPPPNDNAEQDSKTVSHEMKDFSKTAPWRVHKPSGTSQHSALHPWRKSRTEHIMSHSLDDRQLSAAAGRMGEVYTVTTNDTISTPDGSPIQSLSDSVLRNKIEPDVTKPQSSLTYVGKRIESPPVGSPIGVGAPFFKAAPVSTASPAGRDVLPSDRSNSIPMPHTTMPSTSHPNSMLKPSPTSEPVSPQPEEIHFQAAAPDLVDIPMPAVKEMVENLNKRLEAIAVQHPKIAEPATSQELGLNYFKRSQDDLTGNSLEQMLQDYGEREIIINTPPNPHFTSPMLEDIKQQLFGPRTGYQDVYQLLDPTISPGTHRRRFSLPGGSVTHRHNQRRVRFAEPLESSVIEIEPRKQKLLDKLERRRFFDDEGSMSDMEDYSSASSLAAKLDRIERENALSSASFQRHRNAKHRAQSLSGDNAQTKPAETFREKVISFESLGEPKSENVILSSLTPSPKELALGQGRSGSRGFSLSIGQNKPGSISLSLTQRGAGQPPTQVALSVPSTEGHFSYTISPRTGAIHHYGMQPSYVTSEPIQTTTHMKSSSLDSAKTIHIQYPPQEGVPTIQTQLLNTSSAGPLSPPHQVLRQLAGRPGIRNPTNYSNTLQIDTSSRLQHRSPSPPHLALSPNMQSERARLSPQRLVPPLSRLHDTSSLDQQAKRSSSPIQGTPLGQQPGFKIRQPSPTNPMAYQRSVSPQGHPQIGPARQGASPVPYQQVGGPSSTVNLQSSSPRNTSPVSFQQQPVGLQPGLGYQRPVSPQGNVSLVVPQSTPYQPGRVGLVSTPPQRGPRVMQQQAFQPPGYPFQTPQLQQNQRLSPRIPSPGRIPMTGIPRNTGQVMGVRQNNDMIIRSPEGFDISSHPVLSAAVGQMSTAGVPGQLPTSEPMPPGVFALFDKKFAEKFVQWHDDRPEGLYESETYKLVHEMDEESDEL